MAGAWSQASLLLVSEDGGADAIPVLRALCQKLLSAACAGYRRDQVELEPLSGAEARLASIGQRWKSSRPQDERLKRELLREIGSKLAEGERSFVFFHIDGDRPFADSGGGTVSDNLVALQRFLSRIPQLAPAKPKPGNEAAALARAVQERLIILLPYYSIEAWLYQNTDVAIRLCQAHHAGRHVQALADLATDRGALDEISQIKEVLCLRSTANRQLAEQGFPLAAALAAGKSLAVSLARLKDCKALVSALGPQGGSHGPEKSEQDEHEDPGEHEGEHEGEDED